MNFEHQILNVFALHKTAVSQKQHEHDLAHIGYPSLYHISFFIRLEGLLLWHTKKEIYFPDKCCVCGRPKSMLLPCVQQQTRFFLKQSKLEIDSVPHCEKHASKGVCQLLALVSYWSEKAIQISLTNTNLDFLLETKELNQKGNALPPWVVFPEYDTVTSGWRQGNAEYWWKVEWMPFWSALPIFLKQSYLEQNLASAEWSTYLMDVGME